jgi:hypothetical protein
MLHDVRFRVPCGANGDGEHSKRDHSMHGLCPRGQLGGVTDPSGNGSHVQVALVSHFYNPKDSLESLPGYRRASGRSVRDDFWYEGPWAHTTAAHSDLCYRHLQEAQIFLPLDRYDKNNSKNI